LAFRKRYELDEQLNPTMQIVRWIVVLAGFALTRIPGPRWSMLRVAAGFVA
jgi:hypothetical protein